MIKQLDVVFGEEVANTLGGVNRGVIPVQEPMKSFKLSTGSWVCEVSTSSNSFY